MGGGGGDNLSTDLKNIKISDAMTPLSDPISEGKGILAMFVYVHYVEYLRSKCCDFRKDYFKIMIPL